MPRRLALLDHELTHLEVVEQGGKFKVTGDGRPKIYMRPDDWTFTGFKEIVERHGTESYEYEEVAWLVGEQLNFAFELKPKEIKGLRIAK